MKTKLKFFPLLMLYTLIVLVISSNVSYVNLAYKQSKGFQISEDAKVGKDVLVYDEQLYVTLADNLAHGYFSSREQVSIWVGPGYPIILVPFIALNIPLLIAKLMNPLFLYMAVLYFHSTLRLYMAARPAFIFSFLIGLNLPFMRLLPHLATETFVIFLVCGFIYHFCKFYSDGRNSKTQLLLSAIYLGYLALTKILFGYVLFAGLFLFLILFIIRRDKRLMNSLLVYGLALSFCVPYLLYTYSLTGKIFYWGNSGGLSLYWMSTPNPDELGDWYSEHEIFNNPLFINHRNFFNEISELSSIEKDDALKKQAVYNIKNNPMKYLKNWVANVGRLLFHYPYTYRPPSIKIYYFFNMISGMFIVVLSILCIYPSYKGKTLIPYEIYALVLFALIAFAGSSLLSAYSRQFQPLVPVFALWIFFTLSNVIKIEIRK